MSAVIMNKRSRKQHEELFNNALNTIAHEMRTPLTSIIGHIELLEDGIGGPLTPQQRNYVEQLRFNTERLQKQAEDVLEFAKIESGRMELDRQKTNIFTLANTVVKSFAPMANKAGVVITVIPPTSPVCCDIDMDRIIQVLTNLISNALKYSPSGGIINVVIGKTNSHVIVEVHDEGYGIALEHQPYVFDRFYQVHDKTISRNGTGLGLAISRALVQAHGGTIGVFSQVNCGSKFWFTLPLN